MPKAQKLYGRWKVEYLFVGCRQHFLQEFAYKQPCYRNLLCKQTSYFLCFSPRFHCHPSTLSNSLCRRIFYLRVFTHVCHTGKSGAFALAVKWRGNYCYGWRRNERLFNKKLLKYDCLKIIIWRIKGAQEFFSLKHLTNWRKYFIIKFTSMTKVILEGIKNFAKKSCTD